MDSGRANRVWVWLVLSVGAMGCSANDTSAPTTTMVEGTAPPSSLVVDTVAPDPGFSLHGIGYYDVPVLGSGLVRGTGCGSGNDGDPLLDDRLPDGLWFGSLGPQYENYDPVSADDLGYGYARLDDTRLEIDLWCVYAGDAAAERYFAPSCQSDLGCPSSNTSWWFTEDTSNRLRSLPLADDVEYSAEPEVGEPFFPGCSTDDAFVANAAWRNWPVWIAVNDGEVTEILGVCSYYTILRS